MNERTDPTFWALFDTNATRMDPETGKALPRTHHTITGRRVNLYDDIPYYLPEAEARPFLRDASFRVLDSQDQPVVPLSEDAQRRFVPEQLGANFVIADLAELTAEALATRAAMFPGGEKYNALVARSRLMDFIAGAQGRRDQENSASDGAPLGRDRLPAAPQRSYEAAVDLEDADDAEVNSVAPARPADPLSNLIPAGA